MTIEKKDWAKIKRIVSRAMKTSLHCSIATVDSDGKPHITPVGSLVLTDIGKGFYFERFIAKMSRNLETHKSVCIMAVNSGKWFWLKSLFFGAFEELPAIRIYGTVTEKREATSREMQIWKKRIRPLSKLKGYHILWKEMREGREIIFDRFEPVKAGQMTRNLT